LNHLPIFLQLMMKVHRAAFKAGYGIVILAIFTNLPGRDGISINSLHGNVMLAIFNPLQQKHGSSMPRSTTNVSTWDNHWRFMISEIEL
jgi:hypothetical protein